MGELINSAPQTPQLYLKGLLLGKGRERGREFRGGKGREGKWTGGERTEVRREGTEQRRGENDFTHPLSQIPGYTTVFSIEGVSENIV